LKEDCNDSKARKKTQDRKETKEYWKLKEEALDRTAWRTGRGRDHGPVTMQIAEQNE